MEKNKWAGDRNDWEQIEINRYEMDVAALAEWCRLHLQPQTPSPVILPGVNGPFKVDDKDLAALSAYGELIHDGLSARDKDEALDDIYHGNPVAWDTLGQRKYVMRKQLLDRLLALLEQGGKPARRIIFNHLPGAGASLICKAAAWALKNKRPVMELKKIGPGLDDVLLRISNKSGLQLLLLADNDFSGEEIRELEVMIAMRNISAAILQPRRIFKGNSQEIMCGILDDDEAETFLTSYQCHLAEVDYAEKEKKRRMNALEHLARHKEMKNLRLPFFFGMFAFEKDFVSFDDYMDRVMHRIEGNENVLRLLQYLALLTLNLEAGGISSKIGARLAQLHGEYGPLRIVRRLHEICGAPIISIFGRENILRIVHPLIAAKILESLNPLVSYADFYRNFLLDIHKSGGEMPSEDFANLARKLFLAREERDNGKKPKFAHLIEGLEDYAEKRKVFETLIDIFDNDAHFHQYFGRLISYYEPGNIAEAQKMFDKAVELEEANMAHWHARGYFYLRRIRREIVVSNGLDDIYNSFASLVNLACRDFEEALCRAKRGEVRYPANSIIELASIVLKAVKNTEGNSVLKNYLSLPIREQAQWLTKLAERAEMLAHEANNSERELDGYTSNILGKLASVRFSPDELESMAGSGKSDALMLAWLNSVKANEANPERLKKIAEWAGQLMYRKVAGPGLVRQWFSAELRLGRMKFANLATRLRQAKNPKTELLCVYFLSCLYFAECMRGTKSIENECLNLIKETRALWLKANRPLWLTLYYSPTAPSGLALHAEKAPEIACRVMEEVKEPQSGKLYIESNPNFSMFFGWCNKNSVQLA